MNDVEYNFDLYCLDNCFRIEMVEMFFEEWHPGELLSFIDSNTITAEFEKYKSEYCDYLIKESGLNIDKREAMEIMEFYL